MIRFITIVNVFIFNQSHLIGIFYSFAHFQIINEWHSCALSAILENKPNQNIELKTKIPKNVYLKYGKV